MKQNKSMEWHSDDKVFADASGHGDYLFERGCLEYGYVLKIPLSLNL